MKTVLALSVLLVGVAVGQDGPLPETLTRVYPAPSMFDFLPRSTAWSPWNDRFSRMDRLWGEEGFLTQENRPFLDEESWDSLVASEGEDLEGLLARLDSLVPRPLRLRYSVRVGENGALLLQGEDAIRPGTLSILGDFGERPALVDWDVELAAAASISEPQLWPTRTGTSLAIRVEVGPDGTFQGQVLLRHLREEANQPFDLEPGAGRRGYRNPVVFAETGLVTRMVPGAPWVCSIPGVDGGSLVLSLTLEGAAPVPAQDPTLLYLPTLFRGAAGFGSPRLLSSTDPNWLGVFKVERYLDEELTSGFSAWMDGQDSMAIDNLEQRVGWRLARSGTDDFDSADFTYQDVDGGGLISVKGEQADLVRRALLDLAEDRFRCWDVEVELSRSGLTSAQATPIGRFQAPVLLDRWIAFGAGRKRDLVLKWNVDVANAARIANPWIVSVEDGVFGTVRILSDEAGRPGQLDLDLALVVLKEIEAIEVKLAAEVGPLSYTSTRTWMDPRSTVPQTDSTVRPAPAMPAQRVNLELPHLEVLRFQGVYDFDTEQEHPEVRLVRSAHRMFGEGEQVEIRVTVR